MADSDIDSGVAGFVDKRYTQGSQTKGLSGSGSANTAAATPSNYLGVNNLIGRLQGANGTYFTTAMLNSMTRNDMVYALRLIDDAAGI